MFFNNRAQQPITATHCVRMKNTPDLQYVLSSIPPCNLRSRLAGAMFRDKRLLVWVRIALKRYRLLSASKDLPTVLQIVASTPWRICRGAI
ncbi:hypothetical protein ALP22_02366 [Pseudomonas coronafaciens pv. porri]|nr:Unknown protein sequence [Pseudomonas coronafaciens pv. porri]RMU83362.1 hypothetical protein ALP22_02366 [Pseudomonas coronafaciens pv. porri]